METGEDSKAVEDGSVESKLSQSQKLSCKMPGEASGVSCYGENSSGSVLVGENGGGIDVNGGNVEVNDVELNNMFDGVNDLGLEGLENGGKALVGEVVAEENQTARGSSGFGVEKEIILTPQNSGTNCTNGQALVVEGNEGIGVEKVVTEEGVEKGNDAVQLCEVVDSSRKIEVSGDGISLFVEVFGPMDGIINQADEGRNFSDRHMLREGDSDQEDLCERNGTLSSCDGEDTIAKVSETDKSMLDMMKSSSLGEEVNVQNEVAGEDSGNKKSSFIVGDLIWAKTKTQLWWPGMITDPSNSSKGTADSHKNDSFLVKYYGNANFIWCSSSQLKHFIEYFDEMSRQNNSRSFHGAVERAVYEIGRRVKVEMTCSCPLRESRKFSALSADQTIERCSLSKNIMGELGAFSESQFQPASFLQLIKYLAQGASLPGKIKLIITQNCLSAFYHSLGHCQLPMHQLRPTDAKDSARNCLNLGEKDEDLNKLNRVNYWGEEVVKRKPISSTSTSNIEGNENCTGETEVFAEQLSPLRSPKAAQDDLLNGENDGRIDRRSGKCYESRERKKSKYLSYPYINPKKGHEDAPTSGENGEGLEKVPHLGAEMSSNSGQSNGGKKRIDMLGELKDINSSSAEILSELNLTALNCLYSKGRQYSGSVNRFLCGFRRFAFLNIDIANKHIGDEVEVKVDGMTKCSNYGSEGTNGEDAVEHISSSGKPKKRLKKKEDGTSVGIVGSGSVRNALNGSVVIKCQGVGSDTPKSEKVPRKRKKNAGTVLGIPETKASTGLPDLNANTQASSVEDRQVTGSTAFHYGLEPNNRQAEEFALENAESRTVGLLDPSRNNVKFVQLLKDVQAMSPNFLNSIPQQNNMQGETAYTSEVIARQSEANGSSIQFGSIINSFQPTLLLSPGAKPERKKRKRKEKASNLPDLNGSVTESISPENNTADIHSASAQGKPPRKKRRNKSTAVVPDISANYNKAENILGVSAPLTPLAQPLPPLDGLKSPAKPSGSNPQNGDPPDLLFIKKNLEMMTSTLEKAGNNLTPEMRAKLESEIKGFMQRISAMVGSSSS